MAGDVTVRGQLTVESVVVEANSGVGNDATSIGSKLLVESPLVEISDLHPFVRLYPRMSALVTTT